MTKKLILVLLICFALLIFPVGAVTTLDQIDAIINANVITTESVTDFTYDGSSDGDYIYRIQFNVPRDSYVNFTLYYGTSSSVTGSAQSIPTDPLNPLITTSWVELNGVTQSYTFWDAEPLTDYNIAGYATNGTDVVGIAVYSKDYNALFLGNDLIVGYIIPDISHNLIYKLHFTSSKPITITYTSAPGRNIIDRIEAGTETGILEEIEGLIAFGKTIWETLQFVLLSLFYGLLFIQDNFFLILALYIGLTGAMAFNKTRDVFSAIRQFFRYQRSLFEFILDMWKRLVEIISLVRGIISRLI